MNDTRPAYAPRMTETSTTPATLHVVATIPIRADGVELARTALAELATTTREEAGCLAYAAYESGAAPGLFVTVEEWSAQDDLDQHMTTPHVARAFEALGPYLEGEVGLHPLQPLG